MNNISGVVLCGQHIKARHVELFWLLRESCPQAPKGSSAQCMPCPATARTTWPRALLNNPVPTLSRDVKTFKPWTSILCQSLQGKAIQFSGPETQKIQTTVKMFPLVLDNFFKVKTMQVILVKLNLLKTQSNDFYSEMMPFFHVFNVKMSFQWGLMIINCISYVFLMTYSTKLKLGNPMWVVLFFV